MIQMVQILQGCRQGAVFGSHALELAVFPENEQRGFREKILQTVERPSAVLEQVDNNRIKIHQGPMGAFFRPERLTRPGKLGIKLFEDRIPVAVMLDIPENQAIRIGASRTRLHEPYGTDFLVLQKPGHPFGTPTGLFIRLLNPDIRLFQSRLPGFPFGETAFR